MIIKKDKTEDQTTWTYIPKLSHLIVLLVFLVNLIFINKADAQVYMFECQIEPYRCNQITVDESRLESKVPGTVYNSWDISNVTYAQMMLESFPVYLHDVTTNSNYMVYYLSRDRRSMQFTGLVSGDRESVRVCAKAAEPMWTDPLGEPWMGGCWAAQTVLVK